MRAYSRNKRGIAGNLVWINFDRHALLNLFQRAPGTFVADADEIRPQYANVADGSAVFQSSVVRDLGPSISSTIDQLDQITITNTGSDKQLATPWYVDQVLPFDVTLTGANEYGAMCAARIFGVELLNEGSGISIDEAVTEMSATFVARAIEPMAAVASPFQPRYSRPLPCFGTIEKYYRLRPIHGNICLYVGYLQSIGQEHDFLPWSCFCPHRPHPIQNCATRFDIRARNCATGIGAVSIYIPGIGLRSGTLSGVDHKLSIPRTDSLFFVSMTKNVDQINGAVLNPRLPCLDRAV